MTTEEATSSARNLLQEQFEKGENSGRTKTLRDIERFVNELLASRTRFQDPRMGAQVLAYVRDEIRSAHDKKEGTCH